MPTSSRSLTETFVDLLWSLWAELGVASVIRRHEDTFVDPEPLIIVTALAAGWEPRLRDESIDWSIRYGDHISKSRLKNLLADHGLSKDDAFLEYASTVNAHARLGWPDDDVKPIPFRPRARPLLRDLSTPSVVSLRIRAIFGVGARAEIIRVFISRPGTALTGAELAAETSYRKRNVLDSLEALRVAGLLSSFPAGNATRYQLAREQELLAVIGSRPRDFPRWSALLFELHGLVDAVRASRKLSALERSVTAHRVIAERGDRYRAIGMYPPTLPTGSTSWEPFAAWVTSQVGFYARADA